MVYCFDLDGTLCSQTHDKKYMEAVPFSKAIEAVNKLFDQGHTIIIDTARGSTSGFDWSSMTENQLKSWGLKYHKLIVGKKIHADIFIDDKAISAEEWRDSLEKDLSNDQ